MILQPTAVNQGLCWNQRGRMYMLAVILENGLALLQSAGVSDCT